MIRQRDAAPLLNAFGEWLDERGRNVLPKSPVGQAMAYARNQWDDLQTYTRDGELSIDNNVSERSLRAQALGRKNSYDRCQSSPGVMRAVGSSAGIS
jgi:hypothetical protein